MYKKLILGMLCGGLLACNSGGSQTPKNDNVDLNNVESKELNWRSGWAAPIASFFQKGLGWYVSIQNDSDYTYIVKAIPGSSRLNGIDTWEEDTELDRSTTIPPHTTKVIYGESYTSGPKSFSLTTTDGVIKNQTITLHKDMDDEFYITNDSYKTRGEAIFNHGAKNSFKSASTITVLIADVAMIFGGAFIGEEAATKLSTRAAVRAALKDFSIKEAAVLPEALQIQKNELLTQLQSKLSTLKDSVKTLSNKSPSSLTSEETNLLLTSKVEFANLEKQITGVEELVTEAEMNKIAATYNLSMNLNLNAADLNALSNQFGRLYNANKNVVLTSEKIQKLNFLMSDVNPQQSVGGAGNVKGYFHFSDYIPNNILKAETRLKEFKLESKLATEMISKIIKSGYIVPTSTKVLGAAIGGLFGTGASYGVINSFDIAGKDAVFTSLQIKNTGIANVGSFNDTPVGEYLLSCDNLGSESDTTIAMCKKKGTEPQISMLNVKLNLRSKENIVNKNGAIQGGDQYHEHCSYTYNDNGVIYALCDSDDKLLKLNYQHDCADNAEIRFEDNRLVCSKNRYQYLDSCIPVSVKQPDGIVGMVTAQCKGENGVLHDGFSTLDSSLCAPGSDIQNLNGSLICGQYASWIPKGEYLSRCSIWFYSRDPHAKDYGVIGATCPDDKGVFDFVKLNYLNECFTGSTISVSPRGYLRCDTYMDYLTTAEVVKLHEKGEDQELKRLWDLGKIK